MQTVTQLIPQNDPGSSGMMIFDLKARPLFEQARHRAQFYHLISKLVGKPRELVCFDRYVARTVHSAKTIASPVSINRIRGSVNRIYEFDCDFYPLTDDVAMRWLRIASMMLQGKTLPPVELIDVGDVYFVIDGHHRLSVSRMLGHIYIDALVQSAEH
jgi:hypothetical protein